MKGEKRKKEIGRMDYIIWRTTYYTQYVSTGINSKLSHANQQFEI